MNLENARLGPIYPAGLERPSPNLSELRIREITVEISAGIHRTIAWVRDEDAERFLEAITGRPRHEGIDKPDPYSGDTLVGLAAEWEDLQSDLGGERL